jgi:hypothetical protein
MHATEDGEFCELPETEVKLEALVLIFNEALLKERKTPACGAL